MKEIKVKETIFAPGRPKIAVPITGTTPEQIIEECEKAAQMPCDVIEWRADHYLAALENLDEALCSKETYVDFIKILDDINYIAGSKPVIFTIRSKKQGGEIELTDAQNESLCIFVAQSQLADFIDVELFDENHRVNEVKLLNQISQIKEHGVKVILSFHDFEGMPEPKDLVGLAKMMVQLGADISKIAVLTKTEEEAKVLLKVASHLTNSGIGPIITIGMGDAGKATRVIGGRYGSCITFAAGNKASAPGQVDVFTMVNWLDKYYGAQAQ